MKASRSLSYLSIQKIMIASYVWLRIVLSYCVIGAVITTLFSAYAQQEDLLTITLIMATSLCFGVYKAEVARRRTGLDSYLKKLAQHKHRDF